MSVFQKKKLQKVKLSKGYIIFLIAFLIGTIGLKLWQFRWPEATLLVAEQEIVVQVAKTPWHWKKGLSGRESLGEHDAMLFVFPTARRHAFVMRDTKFSIDIVWFNEGRVVDIAPYVPTQPGAPESELISYIPRAPATAVLEFPAGWTDEHGLKIGDSLQIVAQ